MSGKNRKTGKSLTLSIENGVRVISDYVHTLPLTPGVYRMIAADEEVLYVGKAKALKKRVSSYIRFEALPQRLQKMVSLTVRMEFITTHTEADALLLEAELIKKLKPRYNILLRDDKSFPHILIDQEHDFPKISKHRGAQKRKGLYFGPFPSAGDVNRTLSFLQRVFLLRNCSDHVFETRRRPCLQYHIKRCTAPCVGYVDKESYARQVKGARDFMDGKSDALRERLGEEMQEASVCEEYERAALLRDRIKALASVRAHYGLHGVSSDIGDADVLAFCVRDGVGCIEVFFYRAGQSYGNKAYFPRHGKDETPEAVFSAFIAQFYQSKAVPESVVLNMDLPDLDVLQQALVQKQGKGVRLFAPQRGKYKRVVVFAERNAEQALVQHLAHSSTRRVLRGKVAEVFGMDDIPSRIEVYDNSHISGTNMVGGMIVEGKDGFVKKAYRTFNIKSAAGADDYGMMREVLTRRFKRALKEGESAGPGGKNWPDLVLIDGGAGQLSVCMEVLEELGILDSLVIVGIAKGPDRDAGREKFFMSGRAMFQLPVNDPVLHYLQRLRDEAHRFAIGTHRARRKKALVSSLLDQIEGVGAKRKKALLLHFGSVKGVESAGIEDLARVDGISCAMAEHIYAFFHEG